MFHHPLILSTKDADEPVFWDQYRVMARVRIDDTIKVYFRQGIKLFYETRKTRTLRETFERTLALFFHQGWELRNGVMVPILPPVEELPTLAQFRYWYEKEHNLKGPMIAREGKHLQKGE